MWTTSSTRQSGATASGVACKWQDCELAMSWCYLHFNKCRMIVDVSGKSFGRQQPTARLNLSTLSTLRGLCRNLNWKHDEADDSERLRHELYSGFGLKGPARTILSLDIPCSVVGYLLRGSVGRHHLLLPSSCRAAVMFCTPPAMVKARDVDGSGQQ